MLVLPLQGNQIIHISLSLPWPLFLVSALMLVYHIQHLKLRLRTFMLNSAICWVIMNKPWQSEHKSQDDLRIIKL